MFKCFHDQKDSHWHKKASQKYQNRNSQNRQKMFFFLLSSSDGLARYCKNLSQWFTHKTAAYYSEQCTVSQGACSHSLKSYGFQFGTPFALCMCTWRSLSNDLKLLLKTTELVGLQLACSWAWDQRASVCVALSIKRGTWKDWGRSIS